MTDFEALPPRERNLLRYTFLDESTRELFADWDEVARDNVATLRLDAGRHPDDPQCTYTAEAGSPSESALKLLAKLDRRGRQSGSMSVRSRCAG